MRDSRKRLTARKLCLERLEPRWVLASTMQITEFLASNHTGLTDQNRDTSDWIELYNPTDEIVDLENWSLTDDSDQLGLWRFPAVTINPGATMIVFASAKDRTDPGGELHTNFKLSADGDYLALVQPDGITVEHDYADPFPRQLGDISYGIDPGDPAAGPYYYTTPTPNSLHGAGQLGLVEEPAFSIERGMYDAPQTVRLTTEFPGTSIRYTTDGSTPTESHGTLYTSELQITGTTILRAIATRTDYVPSTPVTHTYLFPTDIVQQSSDGTTPLGWPTGPVNKQVLDYGMDPDVVGGLYTTQEVINSIESIPSVSLVTDMDNLFDSSTGIYVNAYNRGDQWEKPVSVELIGAVGTPGFQIDAGVRIRGGFSRWGINPKHAFRLFFREAYDGPLQFPLFDQEGATEFHNIDLRTPQSYSWSVESSTSNSFTREVFSRDTQRDMGYAYTRSKYYHLYLNGEYWGIFQTQERSEASYAATYFGGNADDYDVIKVSGNDNGYRIEATDGNYRLWRDLWSMAVALDGDPVGNIDNYWTMQGLNPDGTRNETLPVLLDVNNLIDYMLIIFYTGNTDGPVTAFGGNNIPNNWYGIINRETQDQGFQFFMHDAEHTLGVTHSSPDRTGPFNSYAEKSFGFSNPQFLHQHLMNHEEYRIRFADRVQKHLLGTGTLTAGASSTRFKARANQVGPAILAESARWGDSKLGPSVTPPSLPEWEEQIDQVLDFFIGRSETVVGQLQADDLYPNLAGPAMNQYGGHVPADYHLLLTTPEGSGNILYTLDGTDPREIGGGTNPNAFSYDGSVTPTTLLAAGHTWNYLDDGSNQGIDWIAPEYDDSTWDMGPAQFGYGDGDEATVVSYGGDSDNKKITAYFRSTFHVGDTSLIADLTLRLLRDDGAAIYLNGEEVARSNLPGTIGTPIDFQERALSAVGRIDESTYNEITIPASLLVSGENSIAVEVHQVSPASSDISFDLELIANEVAQPIILTENRTISARVYEDGIWSPLTENAFIVAAELADLSNLRITEINYHPSDPTDSELAIDPELNDDDFEFIELRNVGPRVIDLTGVRFTDGVAFDFAGSDVTELASGEHVLVVEDQAAFEIRYGSDLPVAGTWSGKLSNGGELLLLEDAEAGIIQLFAYDDEAGWPTEPDGTGPSLEVIDIDGNYNDPANWRASTGHLGTPGTMPDLPGDADGDGDIDGNDLLSWQLGFGRFPAGGATASDGDYNADGNVDQDDLTIWNGNFGLVESNAMAAEEASAKAFSIDAHTTAVNFSSVASANTVAMEEALVKLNASIPQAQLLEQTTEAFLQAYLLNRSNHEIRSFRLGQTTNDLQISIDLFHQYHSLAPLESDLLLSKSLIELEVALDHDVPQGHGPITARITNILHAIDHAIETGIEGIK